MLIAPWLAQMTHIPFDRVIILTIVGIILLVIIIILEKAMSTVETTFNPTTLNVSFTSIPTLMLYFTHILGLSPPLIISLCVDDSVDRVTPYVGIITIILAKVE